MAIFSDTSHLFVKAVSPAQFITGQSKEVTLSGAGFLGSVRVVINGIYIPVSFITATAVKFVLPYIPAGTYDIVVINGNGKSWTSRHALTIIDPPGTHLDLGSVGKPIVLPPVVVEPRPTAIVSTAAKYRNAASSALVFNNPSTGVVTAYKQLDSSGNPLEPVNTPTVQDNPSSGQLISTPWGDFKNE